MASRFPSLTPSVSHSSKPSTYLPITPRPTSTSTMVTVNSKQPSCSPSFSPTLKPSIITTRPPSSLSPTMKKSSCSPSSIPPTTISPTSKPSTPSPSSVAPTISRTSSKQFPSPSPSRSPTYAPSNAPYLYHGLGDGPSSGFYGSPSCIPSVQLPSNSPLTKGNNPANTNSNNVPTAIPTNSNNVPTARPTVGGPYIISPIQPESIHQIPPSLIPSGPSPRPSNAPSKPTVHPSAVPTGPTVGPTEEPTYSPTSD